MTASMSDHMNLDEFRDTGYLAYINWQVLHPLGLALALARTTHGPDRLVVIDHRDDPEGVIYDPTDPEYIAEIDTKIQQVKAEIAARWKDRCNANGTWHQRLPNHVVTPQRRRPIQYQLDRLLAISRQHHGALGYTPQDDGIHLYCQKCPTFNVNLGFDLAPDTAREALARHHQDILDAEDDPR